MDEALGNRLIDLKDRIVEHYRAGDWQEVGLMAGTISIIDGHPRLLRSLSWSDDDYAGNVLEVLRQIVSEKPQALPIIESFTDKKFPGDSEFISVKESPRKITFAPHVFEVPDAYVELDLVAAMMPFAKDFQRVYGTIKDTCDKLYLRCLRVDDIWEESVIVQDIFNLIFRAQVIVVDFTGKNPNVMYETGIAHTLGKHVIPISQSLDDVPFDMAHHRILKYLPNSEGYLELSSRLQSRLKSLAVGSPPQAEFEGEDDVPF